MRTGKMWRVAAVLALLLVGLAGAGSAASIQVEGLSSESINASWTGSGVHFNTSYLDKTVNYNKTFKPDDLDTKNGVQVKSKTEKNDSLQVEVSFEVADNESNYTWLQGAKFSGKIDIKKDKRKSSFLNGSITSDKDEAIYIDSDSHYEHLILDYNLTDADVTQNETTDVYSGEDTQRIPVTGDVEQVGAGTVVQTVTKDNKYEEETEETLVLAHEPETNITGIEWGNLPHYEVDVNYSGDVEPELNDADMTVGKLDNPKDYEFTAYNVTYPADTESSVKVTYKQPEYSPISGDNPENFEFDYYGYVLGSVATFSVDTSSEWDEGTFTNTTESSGVLKLNPVREFDGFEDGDYTNNPTWTEPSSGGTATVQSTTVKEGSNALKITTSSSGGHVLEHDRGTSDSISDGDVYRAWIKQDTTLSTQYHSLSNTAGSGSGDDGLQLYIDGTGSVVGITRDSTGGVIGSEDLYSNGAAGNWYLFEIEINPSTSDATFRVYDGSENLLGSSTLNTSGATNIQYVFMRNSDNADNNVYFDDVSYSTSPQYSTGSYTSKSYQATEEKAWQNVTLGNVVNSHLITDLTVETSNDGFSTVKDSETLTSFNNGTDTYTLSTEPVGEYVRYIFNLEAGSTAEIDSVSIDGETANAAPTIDTKTVTPDPPEIGNYPDYSMDASDSDGTIESYAFTVYDDGTQVFSDSSSTVSTSQLNKTWTDVAQATEGSWDAKFQVTDDAGATATTWLNRTLKDLAPNVDVQDPDNTTYFDYDTPWQVDVSDSDNHPDESITCDLYNDTAQFDSFTVKEGNTASGTFRADLGGHAFNASCTDPAGNTNSSTVDFTVDNYEFQSQTAPSTVYETENTTYTGTWKLGDMVDDLETTLYWNDTARTSREDTTAGVHTTTLDHYFQPPLVQTNTTTEQWTLQYDVNYTEEDGTRVQDTLNTTVQNQDVWWSFWLNQSYTEPSKYIEREDYQHNLVLDYIYNNADVTAENTFGRTGDTATAKLEEDTGDALRFVGSQDSGEASSFNTSSFSTTTDATISFNGRNRSISASDSFDLYRMVLTDGSSNLNTEKAVEYTIYQEENQSNVLDNTTISSRFKVWKTGEVNRTYSWKKQSNPTNFYIYPSWAEYNVRSLNQYEATGYPDRMYWMLNASISNSTSQLPLYLLEDSKSTEITFEVLDDSREPIEDAVIKAQRYYIGQDKYINVAMTKTDYRGKAQTYLRVNQIWYKIILVKDGEILRTYGPMIITDTSLTLTPSKVDDPTAFDYKEDIGYDCSFDNSTQFLSCTVDDTTGMANQYCLHSERQTVTEWQTIEETCANSTSATLTHNLTEQVSDNRTVHYELWAEAGERYVLTTDTLNFGEGSLFGTTGLLLAALLTGTIATLGLWSLSAAGILAVFGLLASWLLGLVQLQIGTLAGLLFLVGYMIWKGET